MQVGPYSQSFKQTTNLLFRHDTMVAFLQLLRDKYGDAENYCRTHLSLTTEDIARIRHNLKNAPRS